MHPCCEELPLFVLREAYYEKSRPQYKYELMHKSSPSSPQKLIKKKKNVQQFILYSQERPLFYVIFGITVPFFISGIIC